MSKNEEKLFEALKATAMASVSFVLQQATIAGVKATNANTSIATAKMFLGFMGNKGQEDAAKMLASSATWLMDKGVPIPQQLDTALQDVATNLVGLRGQGVGVSATAINTLKQLSGISGRNKAQDITDILRPISGSIEKFAVAQYKELITTFNKSASNLIANLEKNITPLVSDLQKNLTKLPQNNVALAVIACGVMASVLIHMKAKRENISHTEALRRGVNDIFQALSDINKEVMIFAKTGQSELSDEIQKVIGEISIISTKIINHCYNAMGFVAVHDQVIGKNQHKASFVPKEQELQEAINKMQQNRNALEATQQTELQKEEKRRENLDQTLSGLQDNNKSLEPLQKLSSLKSMAEIDREIEAEFGGASSIDLGNSLAEIAESNPIIAQNLAQQIDAGEFVNEHEKLQEDIVNTKSAIRDELTKLVKTGAISVLDPDHPINQIRERLNELDQDTPLPKQVEHLRGILELTKDMENYNGTNTPPNMPENVAELFAKYPVPNSGNNVKQTQAIQQFKQNVGEAINKLDDKPLLDAANKNENTKRVAAGLGIGQKPTNGNRNLPVRQPTSKRTR